MEDTKRIVEIGGVKMEVDLRQAKTVESYKVGDNVKVLVKDYGDSYKSHAGVIVGFDDFEKMPTIIIAYIKVEYSGAEIKMVYLNSGTKDIEICPADPDDLTLDKESTVDQLDKQITMKQHEIEDLERKKQYFLMHFGRYFESPVAK